MKWRIYVRLLGSAIGGAVGAVSLVQFIKLVAPQLTKDETVLAAFFFMVAVVCLGVTVIRVVTDLRKSADGSG